jgi:hypothetical protein
MGNSPTKSPKHNTKAKEHLKPKMGCTPSRQVVANDASSSQRHPSYAMISAKIDENERLKSPPSTTALGSKQDVAPAAVDKDACIKESIAGSNSAKEVKIIESLSLFSADSDGECSKELQVNNKENNKNEEEEDCEDKEQQVNNKENNNVQDDDDDEDSDDSPKAAYPSPLSYYAATCGERANSVVHRDKTFLSLLSATQPSWRA